MPFYKKHTPWNKGKPWSDDIKQKMSLSRKGKQSPNKNKKFSEEHCKNLSLSHKGQKAWNKGLKNCYSSETKNKMGRKGRLPWNKGLYKNKELTYIKLIVRNLNEYKQWRSKVFERDNWTCQTCKKRGYVEAHHIKSFAKIFKENNIKTVDDALKCKELWSINNGITLCKDCHKLIKRK